jgi:hypothetical protein
MRHIDCGPEEQDPHCNFSVAEGVIQRVHSEAYM